MSKHTFEIIKYPSGEVVATANTYSEIKQKFAELANTVKSSPDMVLNGQTETFLTVKTHSGEVIYSIE